MWLFSENLLMKKAVAQLTEHDDAIILLLRGAPRLSLALGPALARAGPGHSTPAVNSVLMASQW